MRLLQSPTRLLRNYSAEYLAGLPVHELKAEGGGALAEPTQNAGPLLGIVGVGTRAHYEVSLECSVDEDGFAGV